MEPEVPQTPARRKGIISPTFLPTIPSFRRMLLNSAQDNLLPKYPWKAQSVNSPSFTPPAQNFRELVYSADPPGRNCFLSPAFQVLSSKTAQPALPLVPTIRVALKRLGELLESSGMKCL